MPKANGTPGAGDKLPVPHAGDRAGEFGKEGTNKTVPTPKADGEPSEELGHAAPYRHTEKTPYTRGGA